MCNKAALAAINKVESELAENERIIWSGVADRAILVQKAKTFYWKNVAVLGVLGAAGCGIYLLQPTQSRFFLTMLAAMAVLRLIGAAFAWADRKARKRQAYALTNQRLISVDGKNQEMTSWYAPVIDTLKIKKHGPTASFKMRDSDLGFEMTFHYAPDPNRLARLIEPFRLETRKDQKANARKLRNSPFVPLNVSDEDKDWLQAA